MTPSSTSQPMSARRTAIIGGLMVAAGPLSITLYAPALPTLVADLGTGEAMGKLTLSVYFGAFAPAQLVCGPLSDRFGRKPIAIAFFALYVLGSFAAALAPTIEMLLLGRALQGVGVSAGVALSRAMVRDQFVGSESIRILTLINLILTVAPAIAPTLGSVLLLAGSWHLLFVVMAGFGMAIIAMLARGARETQPVAAQTPLKPSRILANYGRLLRSAEFMAPALLLAIAFGGFYGFSALLPFVLLDGLGLTTFQFAMTMLIQTGSFITGNLVAGQIARRASGLHMVRIGLVLLVLAGLGFAIGPRLFPDLADCGDVSSGPVDAGSRLYRPQHHGRRHGRLRYHCRRRRRADRSVSGRRRLYRLDPGQRALPRRPQCPGDAVAGDGRPCDPARPLAPHLGRASGRDAAGDVRPFLLPSWAKVPGGRMRAPGHCH
ncbi:multidrug effflux MFS transporter [Devosia sp. A8/3-2]|nr:multidrug effflux MFS transporter [Devosia sp. A8/3-2]